MILDELIAKLTALRTEETGRMAVEYAGDESGIGLSIHCVQVLPDDEGVRTVQLF